MYLFVHIPKTAGTSFRKAAESYFGSANTFYDYGEAVKDTSSLVKEFIYHQYDRFGFYEKLNSRPANLLSGHFPIHKFLPLYNLQNVICFMRKPEQQIRSHYEHFVNQHHYKKSFMEFIKEERFINFQSKHLRGVSLQSIGFVGLTERYDESIQMINRQYGFSLPVTHINKNQTKETPMYWMTDEELALIKELNAEDYVLYEKASALFERRMNFFEHDQPLYLGEVNALNNPKHLAGLQINGWLTNLKSSAVAKGKVIINDSMPIMITAGDYRPWANERLSHRKGHIGFSIRLEKPLNFGDRIRLFDEDDVLLDEVFYTKSNVIQ